MENIQVGASHLGIFTKAFSTICGTFFLGIPHEQFNIGHWLYLFKIWTQEQLRDFTTQKVIYEHFTLFQIKQHYDRQNLEPPAELLADLELFNPFDTYCILSVHAVQFLCICRNFKQ